MASYQAKVFSGILALALLGAVGLGSDPAHATTFTWSGMAISGEDPTFFPSGTATFEIDGSQLQLTLTNTSPLIEAIGEALSGLTWDITDSTVTLSPVSATIASGSSLVGVGATNLSGVTNLSGEWAFKDDISAGLSGTDVPLGSFGVGSIGDINFGADTFGIKDRFDPTTNVFGVENLNGIDGAIVGPQTDLTTDGFKSQGPVVQSSMIFLFDFTGSLDLTDIINVQPLFGTDGATRVPEPSTALLVASGLLGLGVLGRTRRFLARR